MFSGKTNLPIGKRKWAIIDDDLLIDEVELIFQKLQKGVVDGALT